MMETQLTMQPTLTTLELSIFQKELINAGIKDLITNIYRIQA